MRTHVSPLRRRLDEILADGEWHDINAVLAALAVYVPPGQAWRRAEGSRRSMQRSRTGISTDRVLGEQADGARTGARRVAYDRLRTAIKHGTVERDGNRVRRSQS